MFNGSHSKFLPVYPDGVLNCTSLLYLYSVNVVLSESVSIFNESHAFSLHNMDHFVPKNIPIKLG